MFRSCPKQVPVILRDPSWYDLCLGLLERAKEGNRAGRNQTQTRGCVSRDRWLWKWGHLSDQAGWSPQVWKGRCREEHPDPAHTHSITAESLKACSHWLQTSLSYWLPAFKFTCHGFDGCHLGSLVTCGCSHLPTLPTGTTPTVPRCPSTSPLWRRQLLETSLICRSSSLLPLERLFALTCGSLHQI